MLLLFSADSIVSKVPGKQYIGFKPTGSLLSYSEVPFYAGMIGTLKVEINYNGPNSHIPLKPRQTLLTTKTDLTIVVWHMRTAFLMSQFLNCAILMLNPLFGFMLTSIFHFFMPP